MTKSVDYIAPSDGYVFFTAVRTTGNWCLCKVNGITLGTVYPISGGTTYDPSQSIFVRKGMTINCNWVNGSAKFYPIG